MFADVIDRGAKFAPAKVPVGNTVALMLGIGVSGGLDEIIKGFLPAGKTRDYGGIAVGFLLAWVFQNINFFRKALGNAGVDALSIGALYHAIESTFFVRSRITGAIANLAPQKLAAPVATASPYPAPARTETAERQYVSSVNDKLRATLSVA